MLDIEYSVITSDVIKSFDCIYLLTLYLIEIPFNAFKSRADPDQVALVRAA